MENRWEPSCLPPIDNEIHDYNSRGNSPSDRTGARSGTYELPSITSRDVRQHGHHMVSHYIANQHRPSNDRQDELRGELALDWSQPWRSSGVRSEYSTYTGYSEWSSPIKPGHASPHTIGRVDLGEDEHTNIFREDDNQHQDFSNDNHGRLF
ncbi:hypothetical protein BIW11_08991 [Tropilaelaps mercedesae]|uniref:Uncharacterized protein n=1 Tax=Tropilaelaps mercedesae TaxID=418985 RepID=A0A1V9XMG6_9ACAR|nr:hypothetical protein BIW11_08991 [Tropilaelaps mercedesae]